MVRHEIQSAKAEIESLKQLNSAADILTKVQPSKIIQIFDLLNDALGFILLNLMKSDGRLKSVGIRNPFRLFKVARFFIKFASGLVKIFKGTYEVKGDFLNSFNIEDFK